jgi:hypothetical protein
MKKYWLWFLIIVIFGSVLIILWFQSKKITQPDSRPNPTPSTVIFRITPTTIVPESTKEQIISKLPFETEAFLVEYLPKAGKFYVTIKAPNHQANYEQAIFWLEEQQIPNPQNNTQIRFVYLEHE